MSNKQFILYVATLMLVFLASLGFGYHINSLNLSPTKAFFAIVVVGSLVATVGVAIGATILSK